jgi:hypothetical protein
MKDYLRAFDGRKCTLDLSNPIVMLKGDDFCDNYARGSLVYPISDGRGTIPGQHHTKGWMTVSTLNTDTANFCGVKIGTSAVPLRTLLQTVGKSSSVTSVQSRRGEVYFLDGVETDRNIVIEKMLDEYNLLRLPANVRFSKSLSKSTACDKTMYESGIIFERLERLAAALIFYNSGIVPSSDATRNRLYSDMWRADHPGAGVDDPSLFRATPEAGLLSLVELMNQLGGGLVKTLVQDVLNSKGRYHKSFDYDAMGTRFFKTSVDVEKVDDKYVLELNAAYVGNKPEEDLARLLELERALVWCGSSHDLTTFGSGWFGIDVDRVMVGSNISSSQINMLSRRAAGEVRTNSGHTTELNGKSIGLSLDLTQDNNYSPEVIRVRNNQLFLQPEGEGKVSFSASLRPAGKERIINQEERRNILKLRDSLADIIAKNLS